MGIVQRFERKLQGAVGDGLARVFGGGVVPQEVESALQREAVDGLQRLDGGHTLAPNSYVITINESDHEELSSDRELTVRAFSRHLEDFIRDQGWQTYGPVSVRFEASPTLHTGQFRTSGAVDPDVGTTPPPRPNRQVALPPANARPSAPKNSGAGQMTQNPGFDPSREPADEGRYPQDRQVSAQNGNAYPSYSAAGGGYDQPRNGYAQGGAQQRNGAEYPANPYPQTDYANPYPPNPDYAQGGSDYASADYAQQDYANPYPPNPDYPAYGQQQPDYAQQDYANPYPPSPDYPAYGQQQPDYAQQADYGQQDYANPYPPSADYPAYGQQQGYGQQPPQQQYGQPYGGDFQGGFEQNRALTATLQLEDGSGRNFQLREGRNVIGRGQEAQFRLPDTGVSRRHIEVRWDGQVAMLSDLGSTNGTTVNGAPVQDWQLADGDVIRAGHSEILVRIV
ncbi:FhaA domain-containing protein [Rhodococcus sp. NPDC058532]|uniref:FhaA domain-containing protein n=1 Tax=Rhodococcus sp. NPDC058532 TaxID=3346540 RepID=UPI0036539129